MSVKSTHQIHTKRPNGNSFLTPIKIVIALTINVCKIIVLALNKGKNVISIVYV
jgi:hypothetical protein